MARSRKSEEVKQFLLENDLSTGFVRLEQSALTSDDAARSLSTDLQSVVKSLVFINGDRPIIVLVGGDQRVDEGKLSEACGGTPIRRASPTEARRSTGFSVGAIPPFGHINLLYTLVDQHLLTRRTLYASAGSFDMMLSFSPNILLQLANIEVADVAAANPVQAD